MDYKFSLVYVLLYWKIFFRSRRCQGYPSLKRLHGSAINAESACPQVIEWPEPMTMSRGQFAKRRSIPVNSSTIKSRVNQRYNQRIISTKGQLRSRFHWPSFNVVTWINISLTDWRWDVRFYVYCALAIYLYIYI